MITLNENKLNTSSKRVRLSNWILKNTQLYAVFKKHTLNIEHRQVENNRVKNLKIHYATLNIR